MSIMQAVLQSPHFVVFNQVCKYPRVNCGYGKGDEPARFIFTRRGSFAIRVGSKTYLARPGQAILLGKHIEYSVSHPDMCGCDCCTDIWIDDAMLDALGVANSSASASREFAHDLQFQKTHVEMLLCMQHNGGDKLEAEEVLLGMLDHLLQIHAPARPKRKSASTARQVERVEEAIIGHAGENLGIDELAKLAGCSPFHLCRIFRQGTGQSLRQFRLQQRLGTALGRLGEGEEDLAALACDVGFSSHSHMTDAFKQALGKSPREMREELRQSDLRRLKARLRA